MAEFNVGAEIADYRLDEQIGRGGMAVVFRAHDEHLDRRVALKILAPELARDTGFRTRFIRESWAAAAVDHPISSRYMTSATHADSCSSPCVMCRAAMSDRCSEDSAYCLLHGLDHHCPDGVSAGRRPYPWPDSPGCQTRQHAARRGQRDENAAALDRKSVV